MFKLKSLLNLCSISFAAVLTSTFAVAEPLETDNLEYKEPQIDLIDNYSELSQKIDFRDVVVNCKKPKRLAIVGATTHIEISQVLQGFFKELSSKGMFVFPSNISEPFGYNDPELWERLRILNRRSCITLSDEPFFNAQSNHQRMKEYRESLESRIKSGDVSMILAIGALPGIYLADTSLGIPVMVADAVNPVAAGITQKTNYSTKPNVHVQLETSEARTVDAYYKILKFKKIGMFADYDVRVHSIQQIETFKELSSNYGFDVELCQGQFYGTNEEVAYRDYIKCIDHFAKSGIDAVFLNYYSGINADKFFKDITPLIEKKVKVIVDSDNLVKAGALISSSEIDVENRGIHEALVAEKIVSGVSPDKIPQFYYSPIDLVLNLQTARLIDWTPDFVTLITAVNLYDTIE